MGGDYYDRPVQAASTSGSTGYSDLASQMVGKTYEMQKAMDPKRWAIEKLPCDHKHPIVFALDVTGSMGDWSKIIYDKMPMFYGQIMMKNYLSDPAISFCAVGDAQYDKAPLQVTEFGQGKEIDQLISKMYLEGGGGGNGIESYEMSAFFYSRQCELTGAEIPFFFLTGDEDFYTNVSGTTVKNLIGSELEGNELATGFIDSGNIWKELMRKFNVFMIKKPYGTSEVAHWKNTLGEERVLQIVTPKACVDVMLGAIAITSGARTLETYIADMVERGQTPERIEEVKSALKLYDSKPKKIVKSEDVSDLKIENMGLEESKEGPEAKLASLRKDCNKVITWEGIDEVYRDGLFEIKKKLADKVPEAFLCPITGEILMDPVMTVDGHSYEKKAIETWFLVNDISPVTGEKLEAKTLIPNVALKKLIHNFYISNK